MEALRRIYPRTEPRPITAGDVVRWQGEQFVEYDYLVVFDIRTTTVSLVSPGGIVATSMSHRNRDLSALAWGRLSQQLSLGEGQWYRVGDSSTFGANK